MPNEDFKVNENEGPKNHKGQVYSVRVINDREVVIIFTNYCFNITVPRLENDTDASFYNACQRAIKEANNNFYR